MGIISDGAVAPWAKCSLLVVVSSRSKSLGFSQCGNSTVSTRSLCALMTWLTLSTPAV